MGYEKRKAEYIKIVQPYLDSNFLVELKQEGRRIERESELILGYELLRNNFKLQEKLSDKGPDFLLIHNDKKVWIEVVTPNEGGLFDNGRY